MCVGLEYNGPWKAIFTRKYPCRLVDAITGDIGNIVLWFNVLTDRGLNLVLVNAPKKYPRSWRKLGGVGPGQVVAADHAADQFDVRLTRSRHNLPSLPRACCRRLVCLSAEARRSPTQTRIANQPTCPTSRGPKIPELECQVVLPNPRPTDEF